MLTANIQDSLRDICLIWILTFLLGVLIFSNKFVFRKFYRDICQTENFKVRVCAWNRAYED